MTLVQQQPQYYDDLGVATTLLVDDLVTATTLVLRCSGHNVHPADKVTLV